MVQAKLDALTSGETATETNEAALATEDSSTKPAETPQETAVEGGVEAVAEPEVEAPPVLDLAKVSGRIVSLSYVSREFADSESLKRSRLSILS